MRVVGVLLLSVLFAAALVLYLQGRSAHEDIRAVNRVATDLQVAGVEGQPLDYERTRRAMSSLARLSENLQAIILQRFQMLSTTKPAVV
jgi:hypothetical protein